MLGENDTAGLNVAAWARGQMPKRDKMSHRDSMSQYGMRTLHWVVVSRVSKRNKDMPSVDFLSRHFL